MRRNYYFLSVSSSSIYFDVPILHSGQENATGKRSMLIVENQAQHLSDRIGQT
jgi:hypothetical protein